MIEDINNIRHYTSEQGKVIVPKEMNKDCYFSTDSIWLSSEDSIDNYEEITLEEWEELKEQFEKTDELIEDVEE